MRVTRNRLVDLIWILIPGVRLINVLITNPNVLHVAQPLSDRSNQEFAFPHPAPEFAPLPGQVLMADGADHGDMVAALAVGDRVGVASRANLVASKMFTQYAVNRKTGERYQSAQWDDTFRSWHWIVNDVRSKNPSRVRKAVINVSAGELFIRPIQTELT